VAAATTALRSLINTGKSALAAAQGATAFDAAIDAITIELADFAKATRAESDDPSEKAAIAAIDQLALAAMQTFQLAGLTDSVAAITARTAKLDAILATLDTQSAANAATESKLRLTSLSATIDAMAQAVASAKALGKSLKADHPEEAAIKQDVLSLVAAFEALKARVAAAGI
jgi:hypothetical protein